MQLRTLKEIQHNMTSCHDRLECHLHDSPENGAMWELQFLLNCCLDIIEWKVRDLESSS